MAFVHGKTTVITVATKDISPYCKTSSFEVTADVHDTTGYGSTAHTKAGGLLDGSFTVSGTYDNTASTGPRNALMGQAGVSLAVVRKVEGTGTGKPQDAFTGVLKKYTETNPVDDMVTWSAEFEISGAIATTSQP
jgi:hypothetical protein